MDSAILRDRFSEDPESQMLFKPFASFAAATIELIGVRREMASREKMQLFYFPRGVESEKRFIGNSNHIIRGDQHQQRSRGNALDV